MKHKLLAILALGLIVSQMTESISDQPQPGPPPNLIDVLTFDGPLEDPLQSQNTGQQVTLVFYGDLSPGAADPFYECDDNPIGLALGINATTFDLIYADGYVVSGSGSIVVISHIGLPGSMQHPWGDHSFIAHLTVTRTNQPGRESPWPRVNNELVGAGELTLANGFGEGTYRIVRN